MFSGFISQCAMFKLYNRAKQFNINRIALFICFKLSRHFDANLALINCVKFI